MEQAKRIGSLIEEAAKDLAVSDEVGFAGAVLFEAFGSSGKGLSASKWADKDEEGESMHYISLHSQKRGAAPQTRLRTGEQSIQTVTCSDPVLGLNMAVFSMRWSFSRSAYEYCHCLVPFWSLPVNFQPTTATSFTLFGNGLFWLLTWMVEALSPSCFLFSFSFFPPLHSLHIQLSSTQLQNTH